MDLKELQNIDIEQNRWHSDKILSGDPIIIGNLSESIIEAKDLRILQKYEIKSIVDYPLIQDGKITGFFGFRSKTVREWTDIEISLQQVAQWWYRVYHQTGRFAGVARVVVRFLARPARPADRIEPGSRNGAAGGCGCACGLSLEAV